MKGVKGTSFGVRFYRRAGGKLNAKDAAKTDIANNVEDVDALEQAMGEGKSFEERTMMTGMPKQNSTYVMPRDAEASVRATNPKKIKENPMTQVKEQALFVAAKAGDCYKIRVLVMEGVDLDARDSQGRTAINIATQYNQHSALKTLLAAREMRRMAKFGELPDTPFFTKFSQKRSENC